jgi:hypothetical protein
MLPKSIIKKYGISKKAWAIYRGTKTKSKKKSLIKTKQVVKVAKKKKSSYKKQKQKTGFKIPMGVAGLLGNLAYGYIREDFSQKLSETEIVKKLPVTDFTDEGVMLAVNWGARKLGGGKIPILSNILRSQKNIEQARLGQTFRDMKKNSTNNKNYSVFIN